MTVLDLCWWKGFISSSQCSLAEVSTAASWFGEVIWASGRDCWFSPLLVVSCLISSQTVCPSFPSFWGQLPSLYLNALLWGTSWDSCLIYQLLGFPHKPHHSCGHLFSFLPYRGLGQLIGRCLSLVIRRDF